jgi:hypothetical protein
MINKNFVIWVLADDRAGNYSQAAGLAESITEKLIDIVPTELVIKKINYNFLAKLPNFVKINGIMGINLMSKTLILDDQLLSTSSPNLIISAGRKTAPIAAFLRNYYHNSKPFVVQIMHPNFGFGKFDLVVLPNHDKPLESLFSRNTPNNIAKINGALTRINPRLLQTEHQKFAGYFSNISSPKIALLVGGNSKKSKFSKEITKNLGNLVSKIANNMRAHLLIINSRRTGKFITEILDENLKCTKTFFKWQKKNWQNPYLAVLQEADFIISTGDSISMCSEVCSLDKPIYIFNPEQICSAKHLRFHQNLFAQKYAKKLEENAVVLDNYSIKKLDETSNVAKLVIDSVCN